jgi:curli biogenesis system outer membrane secretion channel CsgG
MSASSMSCELRVASCGEKARSVGSIVCRIFFLLSTLLYGCASAPEPTTVTTTVQKGPSTVAVWDFDNLSPARYAQPDLGERLAAETTEAILRKGSCEVVERQRLLLVLEEQNLGTQNFVDESTRLRLGKMVGARMMIFGAYQSFGGEQTRIDVRLVDVETGRTVKSVDKMAPSANFQAWYPIVRQAADELL